MIRENLNSGNLIQKYFGDLSSLVTISDDQELDLFKTYFDHKNHPLANSWRNKLVEKNLKLVISIAKQFVKVPDLYNKKYLEYLEYIQEGNIGLIKSFNRFNPYKGLKFSTYATHWIKAYIKKYILETQYGFRFGKNAKETKLFWKLKRFIKDFQSKNPDKILTNKDIAIHLGIEDLELISDFRYAIDSTFVETSTLSPDNGNYIDKLIDRSLVLNIDLDTAFDYCRLNEKIVENKDSFFENLSNVEKLVYTYRVDPKNQNKPSLRKTSQLIESELNEGCSYENVRLIQNYLLEKIKNKFVEK